MCVKGYGHWLYGHLVAWHDRKDGDPWEAFAEAVDGCELEVYKVPAHLTWLQAQQSGVARQPWELACGLMRRLGAAWIRALLRSGSVSGFSGTRSCPWRLRL